MSAFENTDQSAKGRLSQVAQQLGDLDHAVMTVQKLAMQVYERLDVVLRPQGPQEPSENTAMLSAAREPRAPLAEQLEGIEGTLSGVRARLEDILNRLEL